MGTGALPSSDLGRSRYRLDALLSILLVPTGQPPPPESFVVNAVASLYPEISRSLPRAWRSAKAFSTITATGEGQAVSLEILECVVEWLENQFGWRYRSLDKKYF